MLFPSSQLTYLSSQNLLLTLQLWVVIDIDQSLISTTVMWSIGTKSMIMVVWLWAIINIVVQLIDVH